MAEWHERAAKLKAANPMMTSAQIAAAVGKSPSAVRISLMRLKNSEQGEERGVTPVTKPVTKERNVTPKRALDVESIDMASLLVAARDTAIEIMTDPRMPPTVRAGTAVQVLNGPHGKALVDALSQARSPDEDPRNLPEYVEEVLVAMRRRVSEST